MNKKQAAEKMINQEMNAIPLSLIEKAYPYLDGWSFLTPLKVGEYVEYNGHETEIVDVGVDGVESLIIVSDHNNEEYTVDDTEVEREDSPIFPMWGTVWQAVDPILNDFIRNNMNKVAACGFEIYEAEDVDGYILGIDGAGYDFYEAHWIPLYEAQGLKWHEEA